MALLLIQPQQAGLGLIGWFVVFAAFYFLKDIVFKKGYCSAPDIFQIY